MPIMSQGFGNTQQLFDLQPYTMKIVIDDKIPFIRGEAEKLGEPIYLPGKSISNSDVKDADALIIRTRTRCDANLLEHSKVKFIATATIGYDHLDVNYLSAKGISWANCPGCNAKSVAQYVENVLLLFERENKIRLNDSTIGIVGVGNVGKQVEKALKPYGAKLLLCDPPRKD